MTIDPGTFVCLPLRDHRGDVELSVRRVPQAVAIKDLDGDGFPIHEEGTRGDIVGAALWRRAGDPRGANLSQPPNSSFDRATAAWSWAWPAVVVEDANPGAPERREERGASTNRDLDLAENERGLGRLIAAARPATDAGVLPLASAIGGSPFTGRARQAADAFFGSAQDALATPPDDRYILRRPQYPSWASPLLRQQIGVVLATTEERQHDAAMLPAFLGLFAEAAAPADEGGGTRVYATGDGAIDTRGWAPIDALTVPLAAPPHGVEPGTGAFDPPGTDRRTRVLPLTSGGLFEERHAAGRSLGYLANVVTAGPACERHRYSGRYHAGHLRADAPVYYSRALDGPWDLTPDFLPDASLEGSQPQRVIFGFDPLKEPEALVPGMVGNPAGLARPGVWGGIVWVPYLVDEPPPDQPREPPPGGGKKRPPGGPPLPPPETPPAAPKRPPGRGRGVPRKEPGFEPLKPPPPSKRTGDEGDSVGLPGGERRPPAARKGIVDEAKRIGRIAEDEIDAADDGEVDPSAPKRAVYFPHEVATLGLSFRAAPVVGVRTTDDIRYVHRTSDRQRREASKLPPVATISPWGYETWLDGGDRWTRTRNRGQRRYREESARGGLVILPPEVGLEHYDSDYAPTGIDRSEVCVCLLPDRVGLCFATPRPDKGYEKTGYSMRGESTTGDLVFKSLSSVGAATERMRVKASGLVVLGDDATDVGTPALKGGTGADELIIRNGPDSSYLGIAAGYLRAHKTDSISGAIQAANLSASRIYELPDAAGTLALAKTAGRDGPSDALTGTLTKTTVETHTIAASRLTLGSTVRVTVRGAVVYHASSVALTTTVIWRVGSTEIISHTIPGSAGDTTYFTAELLLTASAIGASGVLGGVSSFLAWSGANAEERLGMDPLTIATTSSIAIDVRMQLTDVDDSATVHTMETVVNNEAAV